VFPPTLQAMTSSPPEEIMLITNDMFSKLSTCRNKYEQLAVIAEMATKYILNDKLSKFENKILENHNFLKQLKLPFLVKLV
jgi:hypothetical protein